MVAGHVCLDLIPLVGSATSNNFRPGALQPVGPITLAPGGCVGNTGIALSRLGQATTLVAHVGADPLGRILQDVVQRAAPGAAIRFRVVPRGLTSYSVVLSRPQRDRSILHFPGVNASFDGDDVPIEVLAGASLLHAGYPPLMDALVADGGQELRRLLSTARSAGVTTSLDMANVGSRADVAWLELLSNVLPQTDVFLPSLGEVSAMLGSPRARGAGTSGPSLGRVAALAERMLRMGVAIAGVKLGEHGLYVRTSSEPRIGRGGASLGPRWARRELYSSVFEAKVVGTTGAGDATIAGFLLGLLEGMSPEETITAACAVGAFSTEAADGTSAVPLWSDVAARRARGWPRRRARPGPGWRPAVDVGLWYGPHDAVGGSR